MEITVNSSGTKEGIISAKIISISSNIRVTDSSEAKEYRLCTVEIIYPDQTKDTVGALLWENLKNSNPNAFYIGATVNIRVQLEGNYTGYAIIELKDLGLIERNLNGLPKNVTSKILWIEDKFRTNPLSHQPGGNDVVIEYKDGKVYGYDKIKSTSLYVSEILHKNVLNQHGDFGNLAKNKQLEIVKIYILNVYAKNYNDDNDSKIKQYEKVWDSVTSKNLPWEDLKEFDDKNNGVVYL